MNRFVGSTHLKKSDIIKSKLNKKYDVPIITNTCEQYGRIVSCLGLLQFKVELKNKTFIRVQATNTFKKSRKGKKGKNPKYEKIFVGSLVKIEFNLGLYHINHVYSLLEEEELIKLKQDIIIKNNFNNVNNIDYEKISCETEQDNNSDTDEIEFVEDVVVDDDEYDEDKENRLIVLNYICGKKHSIT